MKKIQFTKKQYEVLLKLVYLGEWMVNANRLPGEIEDNSEKLTKFLYSFAKEFDLSDLVVEEDGCVAPSRKFELNPEIIEVMEEYDDHVFWDALSDRLSIRDAIREHGEKKLNAMDRTKRFVLLCSLNDKYQAHFQAHRLEKITFTGQSDL